MLALILTMLAESGLACRALLASARQRCPGRAEILSGADRVRRPGKILSRHGICPDGQRHGNREADDPVASTDKEALHHRTNVRSPCLRAGKDTLAADQTAGGRKDDLHAGPSLRAAANLDLPTPSLCQLAGDGEAQSRTPRLRPSAAEETLRH